jgi:hypothetical protein
MAVLEPDGKSAVLCYDVPQPTSYPGRAAIDLGVNVADFKPQVAKKPGTRTPAKDLEAKPVKEVDAALGHGAVDPKMFPHLRDALPLVTRLRANPFTTPPAPPALPEDAPRDIQLMDQSADQPAPRPLRDLAAEEILANLKLNQRPRIYRTLFGDWTYSFVPEPVEARPRLLLIETYRLSNFLGKYGAGGVVDTFSMFCGQGDRISVKSFYKSESDRKSTSSVLDSFSSEAALDVQTSIEIEQSSKQSVAESSEYELGGNAGLDLGFLKIGGGGGGGGAANAAREEMGRRATTGLSKHAQKASAKRDIAVNTSFEVKEQAGEETATEREVNNINVGRTLNYVFRQLNQEFITLLHLVDVRVAFFNGYVESKREVPLYELDDLLKEVMVDDEVKRAAVRKQVIEELSNIFDYNDETQSAIEERIVDLNPADNNVVKKYLRVRKGEEFSQVYRDVSGNEIKVPGIILRAEPNTLRTNGLIVEPVLGQGEGLDVYSRGLQTEAVEERSVANRRARAEADKAEIGVKIVRDRDSKAAKLYAQVFPPELASDAPREATRAPVGGG